MSGLIEYSRFYKLVLCGKICLLDVIYLFHIVC